MTDDNSEVVPPLDELSGTECIQISDVKLLQQDLEKAAIDKQRIEAIEHQDEEEAVVLFDSLQGRGLPTGSAPPA